MTPTKPTEEEFERAASDSRGLLDGVGSVGYMPIEAGCRLARCYLAKSAELESLRAEVERLSVERAWVPAAERLPEKPGSYLVKPKVPGWRTCLDAHWTGAYWLRAGEPLGDDAFSFWALPPEPGED